MSNINVNAQVGWEEFFSNYMFHPNAEELSEKEKSSIKWKSIALGIATLGIAHIICYFAFEKPVSILDRYKTPETTAEVQSGTIDEIFNRIINPNAMPRRHFLAIRCFDYHCHDAKTENALKLERTPILQLAEKIAKEIDTLTPKITKEQVQQLIGHFDYVCSGDELEDVRTKLVDFGFGTDKK